MKVLSWLNDLLIRYERISKTASYSVVFLTIITQLPAWLIFIVAGRVSAGAFMLIGVLAVMCMWSIYYTTRVSLLKRATTWHQVTLLADCLILIVVYFASIYSLIRANGNFNIPLSRVDAIYFSLGMLTTAGTGNIVPQSDLARGMVSIQMVFDFIFVAITVVIAITNLSERWSK